MVVTAVPVVASPSTVPAPTANVDCVVVNATGGCDVVGNVYALVQVGDRTYIGGEFKTVSGVARSNVAAIRGDGTLDPTWNPSTDGTVYALAASNDGSKIFLGGTFTTVGGQAHANLAAVTPDTGALITTWKSGASQKVRALATDNGDRLYVGGNFCNIGGQWICRLAAVSQSTGVVLPTFKPTPDGNVISLTVSEDGSKVFAGGSFTAVSGVPRKGIAEVDAAGALAPFSPKEGGVTIALDVTPSGRLFASTSNNRLWAYDTGSDSVPEYVIPSSGEVQGILALDEEVYVGGHFTSFSKAHLKRVQVASIVTSTGRVTDWAPAVNGWYGVWALGLTRTPLSPNAAPALSIVGGFGWVSGVSRRGYARFMFTP